jgi:peroxiredoxin
LKLSLAILTAFVLAASPASTPNLGDHTPPSGGDPRGLGGRSPLGPEPPVTLVAVGDPAPDFSFASAGNRWLHLHDLLAQGSVLLVFATEDDQLVAVERERDRLLDLGVVPVAVVDRRSGSVASTVKRLGLDYLVIPDLPRAIASQFNVLDPDTRSTAAAWFVIDRRARVRALNRDGAPTRGYSKLAASALAIPLPGVVVPTHTR